MYRQKLLLWQLITFNCQCNARLTFDVVNLSTAVHQISLTLILFQIILYGASCTSITHHRLVGGTNFWFCLQQVIHKCKNHTFEIWDFLLVLFKSRFISPHIDPSWGVTAVIRDDTFLVDYLPCVLQPLIIRAQFMIHCDRCWLAFLFCAIILSNW